MRPICGLGQLCRLHSILGSHEGPLSGWQNTAVEWIQLGLRLLWWWLILCMPRFIVIEFSFLPLWKWITIYIATHDWYWISLDDVVFTTLTDFEIASRVTVLLIRSGILSMRMCLIIQNFSIFTFASLKAISTQRIRNWRVRWVYQSYRRLCCHLILIENAILSCGLKMSSRWVHDGPK